MANELRRQGMHVLGGLFLVACATLLPKALFTSIVIAAFVLGCTFIFLFSNLYKHFFGDIEREESAFRGKGAVFLGLGVLFTTLLFYEHAALAILILTIPDAAATIFGALFPHHKLPYNKRKTFMGSAVFFVLTSLLLSVYYQELAIFFIALLLTALESFDYREIPFLDDNLVIPVVAAYLLTFL